MPKKARPRLKGYLETGKVHSPAALRTHSSPEPKAQEEITPIPQTYDFLKLLAESDRKMWESILSAGTEIQTPPLDFVSVREDFRTLDRTRFTCYILEREGEPLRAVRSSVQIREPLALLLKWDERGVLTLFHPSVK